MANKITLATILVSVLFVVLGVFYLYSHFSFYKQSQIATAQIISVDEPDICPTPGQCKFGRKISIKFMDSNRQVVSVAKEVSTITAISGIFSAGGNIKVLYKPTPTIETSNSLIKNIGSKPYDIKIYTWHYWLYPILTILIGPLLYWIVKKRV